jgi:hypothetical protein
MMWRMLSCLNIEIIKSEIKVGVGLPGDVVVGLVFFFFTKKKTSPSTTSTMAIAR